MSQALAPATLVGRTFEIVAGLDRRLGDFLLQVLDGRPNMLYTSLWLPSLDWTDIDTLRAKVTELRLQFPRQLLGEAEGDGLRRAGSGIVRDTTDGPAVTLVCG